MARARAQQQAAQRRSPKIRSGDHVKVISGKDRGKQGRVLRVEPTKNRLYVEGLNMAKRHVRPRAGARNSPIPGTENQLGGVIDAEGPIHVSNVMLLDAKGQPTRVRIKRAEGKRVRIAARTGTELD